MQLFSTEFSRQFKVYFYFILFYEFCCITQPLYPMSGPEQITDVALWRQSVFSRKLYHFLWQLFEDRNNSTCWRQAISPPQVLLLGLAPGETMTELWLAYTMSGTCSTLHVVSYCDNQTVRQYTLKQRCHFYQLHFPAAYFPKMWFVRLSLK